MSKPIILIFVGCYLPGYKSGGPVRTISNMVSRLSEELDFHIVTADKDMSDTMPYPNVFIDGWNTVGNAKVFYASSGNLSVRSLARLISDTPHDLLYLNSFFSPYFTIYPLIVRRLGLIPKRPVILAPRGEFSKGALALKWWKKRLYLVFMKIFGLNQNIFWQASSQFEAEDIRKVLGSISKNITIAPDLPSVPDVLTFVDWNSDRSAGGPLRVCFLSRISPMKNLDYALRVLAEVKAPVVFSIYGVTEDVPYWQLCQDLIKNLPPHVAVHYQGAIEHAKVAEELAKYDLFYLPTRGENFGHVIHEALSSGLPVLISDQTPWRNLEEAGVGWDIPLSHSKKFCAVIEAQAKMTDEERLEQRRAAIAYAGIISKDDSIVNANLLLFENAINKFMDKCK